MAATGRRRPEATTATATGRRRQGQGLANRASGAGRARRCCARHPHGNAFGRRGARSAEMARADRGAGGVVGHCHRTRRGAAVVAWHMGRRRGRRRRANDGIRPFETLTLAIEGETSPAFRRGALISRGGKRREGAGRTGRGGARARFAGRAGVRVEASGAPGGSLLFGSADVGREFSPETRVRVSDADPESESEAMRVRVEAGGSVEWGERRYHCAGRRATQRARRILAAAWP